MGQVQEECQGKPLREVTSDAESRMMRNQSHWMGRDGLHVFRRNTWLQKLLLRIYTPSSSAREEGSQMGVGGSDGKRICGMSAGVEDQDLQALGSPWGRTVKALRGGADTAPSKQVRGQVSAKTQNLRVTAF